MKSVTAKKKAEEEIAEIRQKMRFYKKALILVICSIPVTLVLLLLVYLRP